MSTRHPSAEPDPAQPAASGDADQHGSLPRTVTRIGLGAFMTAAGIGHLTVVRDEFQAQVPNWFPVDADTVVLVSGVAEIALGLSFAAIPRYQRQIGAALAGFFVVIFPGNIAQYVEGNDGFGLDTDGKRLARLFGQPLLIAAALYGGNVLRRRR
ncbi:hypothetical protein ACMYYO_00660 [Dermacoccaceae bacterium W4C1]